MPLFQAIGTFLYLKKESTADVIVVSLWLFIWSPYWSLSRLCCGKWYLYIATPQHCLFWAICKNESLIKRCCCGTKALPKESGGKPRSKLSAKGSTLSPPARIWTKAFNVTACVKQFSYSEMSALPPNFCLLNGLFRHSVFTACFFLPMACLSARLYTQEFI